MTKEDYERAARMIKEGDLPVFRQSATNTFKRVVAMFLIAFFSEDNENFDSDRFMDATGLNR